ncbi:MAG: hypothetical protein ACF788_06190, partial [Novipirellula sp. JB048]
TNAAITRVGMDVGIRADDLISIRRGRARSLDGQPYQSQDIEIDLRNVTLEQATRLLVELETMDSSVVGTKLSLRAPTERRSVRRDNGIALKTVAGSDEERSVDRWSIRLALTRYVIRATSV